MSEVDREVARAKLTRTFRVIGRRDDGYHLISSEMVTLALADDLEFTNGNGLEIRDAIDWTGEPRIDLLGSIEPGANLVERALTIARRQAHVRLTKRIPPGAGLGGGSADAAAVLRWAGEADSAKATRLGADVPFCLRGGHAIVSGVGDLIEPLEMVDAVFVLVVPAIPVSTAAVYRAFDELETSPSDDRSNDLAPAALVVEPGLARFRDLLADVSARTPTLAGSGAAWFVECRRMDAGRLAQEVRAAIRNEKLVALVVATQTDA